MKVRNNFMILKPGTEIWITGRMGFPWTTFQHRCRI
jgi:hypothetical protein